MHKTRTQKVKEKAAYDKEYRKLNREMISDRQHAYYLKTFDPVRARKERRKKRYWQRAYAKVYNSIPANKSRKAVYDTEYRAAKYGEFAEAYKALGKLLREIRKKSPDKYERLKARGYYERTSQQRKLNAQISRH